MPGTTLAFTIGALGMIGVPPIAGFVSKWYLGLGAVAAGESGWVLPVLIASSLLNAAYFLPILYRAWFLEPAGRLARRAHTRGAVRDPGRAAVAAGGDGLASRSPPVCSPPRPTVRWSGPS